MTCKTHYNYAVDYLVGWFVAAVDWFVPMIGEALAVAAVLVLMAPVAFAFLYATRVLVPKFMMLYYEETIAQKARHYWPHKCVGTGMNLRGAKLSIAIGLIFYFMLRFIVALPMYYRVTLPALAFALIGVAVIGLFCRGNIPRKPSAWGRYMRRFYAPTVTGLGVGVATIFL